MTDPPVDYARLAIFSLDGWTWQVHANQSFLGRSIFRLERPETGSLAALEPAEWFALRRALARFERVLDAVYAPERYEYGQLGNEYPQLHVHAVPRYAGPRRWGGAVVEDLRAGGPWAPTPPSPLGLERVYAFAAWLRARALEVDPDLPSARPGGKRAAGAEAGPNLPAGTEPDADPPGPSAGDRPSASTRRPL